MIGLLLADAIRYLQKHKAVKAATVPVSKAVLDGQSGVVLLYSPPERVIYDWKQGTKHMFNESVLVSGGTAPKYAYKGILCVCVAMCACSSFLI